jgi:hypothetical protein
MIMRKTKRFSAFLLAIMLFCSCFLFTGCADEKARGTYHLSSMTYVENNTTMTVKMNVFMNMLAGYSMKLILHEDGKAEMIEKLEGVETVSTGTWAERENGDVEMLFADQTTIATHDGKKLTVVDGDSTMVFEKLFFNF